MNCDLCEHYEPILQAWGRCRERNDELTMADSTCSQWKCWACGAGEEILDHSACFRLEVEFDNA